VSGDRRPLAGLTVLDFGHFIAGPLCGAMLADFGATVIRVERPQGAADRYVQPLSPSPETPGGGLYLQLNRNKKSLALDPFKPEARPIIDRLAERADIVIANFPAATLMAMGLAYDRLRAINPRIIVCTCTAYGGDGELASRPGFDGIGQAMSGAMDMTGEHGTPRKAYVNYVDYLTASFSAFGIMAALRVRDATGQGQQVETSLLGTALFTTTGGIAEEVALKAGRVGTGNRGQLAAPSDTFRAVDGWFIVQTAGDSMFRRCAKLIGHEEWIADPRFTDDLSRGNHSAELSDGIAAWARTRTVEDCIAALAAVGIPSAPVLSFGAALTHPAIAGRGFWREHAVPGIERPIPVSQPPVRLSDTPGSVERVAPSLGADTMTILREIGLTDREIDDLKDAGAI
jgi:crotonobetainyl-CoA:carnitine CoA-transferase CaiB-like acyl-CoA transferase